MSWKFLRDINLSSKIFTKMLWTNKTCNILRFNGTVYVTVFSGYKFRNNPNKSKGEKTYRMSQDHIEHRLYWDSIELHSWDKIVETSWKEWTVIGIDPYGDILWKHLEATMRERNSDMHQTVTIKKKAVSQPEYDPILKEYTGETVLPATTTVTFSALVDENQKHKEKWIHELGEGKYENINYIMTLELDEIITKEDMVILPDWELYLVDWIYKLPYQVFHGLKKSFKSSSYHE